MIYLIFNLNIAQQKEELPVALLFLLANLLSISRRYSHLLFLANKSSSHMFILYTPTYP